MIDKVPSAIRNVLTGKNFYDSGTSADVSQDSLEDKEPEDSSEEEEPEDNSEEPFSDTADSEENETD